MIRSGMSINRFKQLLGMKITNSIIRVIFCAIFIFAFTDNYCQSSYGIINYDDYLLLVGKANPLYAAEKYNIDIASANLSASKAFNSPQLSFGYSDNQDHSMQMGKNYEAGVEYSFYTGNMRRAKIRVADTEKRIAVANVKNYYINLLADASDAYIQSVRLKRLLSLSKSAFQQAKMISYADSLRYAAGEITRADFMQSALETNTVRNEYLRSMSEYQKSIVTLLSFVGEDSEKYRMQEVDTNLNPIIMWAQKYIGVPEDSLYNEAERNRADLLSAYYARELSDNNLSLVRAARSPEIGLSAGMSHNTQVRNVIAPAPSYNGFTFGLTIPIKFSSLNKGEINAAKYQKRQAEKALESAIITIRNDVKKAFLDYSATLVAVQRYKYEMLSDADAIFKSRLIGYAKGETSLLELIVSRRNFNEVSAGYINAECDLANAANELCRALGYIHFNAGQ